MGTLSYPKLQHFFFFLKQKNLLLEEANSLFSESLCFGRCSSRKEKVIKVVSICNKMAAKIWGVPLLLILPCLLQSVIIKCILNYTEVEIINQMVQ